MNVDFSSTVWSKDAKEFTRMNFNVQWVRATNSPYRFPMSTGVREVVHHRPYAYESTGGFHCLLEAPKRCIGGLLNFLYLRFV